MLYDKRWDQETKTKTPSLDGLIAWLETKDPSEKYDWGNCDGACLVHQYLTSCGIRQRDWSSFYFKTQSPLGDDQPTCIAFQSPHTFGAALSRARAVRDSGNPYPDSLSGRWSAAGRFESLT
jgi:hypothetical protein